MSTQPPIVQPTLFQALEPAWLTTWVKLIKAHEKLAIVIILAVLGFYGYSKGIDTWDNIDKRHVASDQAALTASHNENVILAQELATLKSQVDTQAKQLSAATAARHTATQKQQEVDKTLPLPDLGKRWTLLLALEPGDIAATTDGKLTLTEPAARATVNALETIPDLTLTVTNTQAELAGCNAVRAKQDQVIAGKDNELALEKKGRADDNKLAKVAQRKSWIKGFKWGFVTGFVSGIYVGHHI